MKNCKNNYRLSACCQRCRHITSEEFINDFADCEVQEMRVENICVCDSFEPMPDFIYNFEK